MRDQGGRNRLPWLPEPPSDFHALCAELDVGVPGLGDRVRALAWHDLSPAQARTLSRAVHRLLQTDANLEPLSSLKLGVLPCAEFRLVADVLPAAAARHGVALSLELGRTGGLEGELLQAEGPGFSFDPDLTLVDITAESLGLDHLACSTDDANRRVEEALARVRSLCELARKRLGGSFILQTLASPPGVTFGSADRTIAGAPRSMVSSFNVGLAEFIQQQDDVLLLDTGAVAEIFGLADWHDARARRLWGAPFALEAIPLYADYLSRLLSAFRGRARKCLVLDLDNTIWGGAVGDDGVAALEVGPGTPLGESYAAVQRLALDLKSRGVTLAVVSKNDDHVAREPFRTHPGMLLTEADINIFQADWTPKPDALEAIAKALEIGLDALVLLDDNPAERAVVRAALPSVAVPDLPDDPAEFADLLAAAGLFETLAFTEEDRARASHHLAEARRLEVRETARDLHGYLRQLEMRIQIGSFQPGNRQRVAQLLSRSNQFNLTTRRHDAGRVAQLEAEAAYARVGIVSDRYGGLGLVTVLIALEIGGGQRSVWEIDTWVMSCRALGRRIEEAMLADLCDAALHADVEYIEGVYRPTLKNTPVENHYSKLGFDLISKTDSGETRWRLPVVGWRPPELPFDFVADEAR